VLRIALPADPSHNVVRPEGPALRVCGRVIVDYVRGDADCGSTWNEFSGDHQAGRWDDGAREVCGDGQGEAEGLVDYGSEVGSGFW
jgi:hypothetical protein